MIDKDMNSACMQGGSVRPLTSYQSNAIMEPRSPHPAWQFGTTQVVKPEPMEEEKNDSGITSGSDFHSSSPGSDTSQDLHHLPYQIPRNQHNRFCALPLMPQAASSFPANPYNHNPLTPPNSEPLVSPKSEKEEKDMETTTLTPCASPTRTKHEENQDHLRRLEISLQKSGLFASKTGDQPLDLNSNKSDDKSQSSEDESLRVPKINSHGKVKTFKCKQCGFIAITKVEQWEHSKIHIKEEKRLTCPKCPFITEYKHHLEYHLRNHAGSKPFQCSKCEYTCVNKSMLNSHMKSHSNIYPYRCRDCVYATKYCHSLKIHLRRHEHAPNVVLDEQGNPCPDIIIDVHGTRRGPKVKSQTKKNESAKPKPEVLPFAMNLMAVPPEQLPFPALPFFGGFPNAQLIQQLIRERQAALQAASPNNAAVSSSSAQENLDPNKVLDLSKPVSSSGGEHQKNRRKGSPFKIDQSVVNESDNEDEEASTTMFSNVEAVVQNQDEEMEQDAPVAVAEDAVADNNNNKEEEHSCQFCNISFGDSALHSLHMGYHGHRNPFTCNMCGEECQDKVTFFLHIARVSHS